MESERGGILKFPFRALMEIGMEISVQDLASMKPKLAATTATESLSMIMIKNYDSE